jgi:hypothetical protein
VRGWVLPKAGWAEGAKGRAEGAEWPEGLEERGPEAVRLRVHAVRACAGERARVRQRRTALRARRRIRPAGPASCSPLLPPPAFALIPRPPILAPRPVAPQPRPPAPPQSRPRPSPRHSRARPVSRADAWRRAAGSRGGQGICKGGGLGRAGAQSEGCGLTMFSQRRPGRRGPRVKGRLGSAEQDVRTEGVEGEQTGGGKGHLFDEAAAAAAASAAPAPTCGPAAGPAPSAL